LYDYTESYCGKEVCMRIETVSLNNGVYRSDVKFKQKHQEPIQENFSEYDYQEEHLKDCSIWGVKSLPGKMILLSSVVAIGAAGGIGGGILCKDAFHNNNTLPVQQNNNATFDEKLPDVPKAEKEKLETQNSEEEDFDEISSFDKGKFLTDSSKDNIESLVDTIPYFDKN